MSPTPQGGGQGTLPDPVQPVQAQQGEQAGHPHQQHVKGHLQVPKGKGVTRHTASTNPSPARVTTPATTSRATPTPTRNTPARHSSHRTP